VTWALGFSSLIWRTAQFSRLLWHALGCGGSIITWVLTGSEIYKDKGKQAIRKAHSNSPLKWANNKLKHYNELYMYLVIIHGKKQRSWNHFVLTEVASSFLTAKFTL
jgi:hypothetical protein